MADTAQVRTTRTNRRSANKAPSTSTSGTAVRKILQGAFVALGRQGSRRLSIGAICEAANVARGTFYRYFSTKDDVLTALSEFVSESFIAGIRDAAAESPEPMDILRNVLAFHGRISAEEQQSRIYEVEPEFVMGFLRDHFEAHVGAMQDALDPVFAQIEQQRDIRPDRRLIAEALIRLQLSTVLIPGDRHWESIPDMLFDLFQGMVGAPYASRRARAPGSSPADQCVSDDE